jgi:hypothetical protein
MKREGMSMESVPLTTGLTPPLRLAWQSNTSLKVAVAGNGRLYGITSAGSLVAINGTTGEVLWSGREAYLPTHIVRHENRLWAYVQGKGLGYVQDEGNRATEQLVISFGATATTNLCNPAIDGTFMFAIVNRNLFAYHLEQGLQAMAILPDLMPYSTVHALGNQELILINGRGVPARYRYNNGSFSLVWDGEVVDPNAGRVERPSAVVGSHLLVGLDEQLCAYQLGTGRVAWRSPVETYALSVKEGVAFTVSAAAAFAAVNLTDGRVLWKRRYMFDRSIPLNTNLACTGGQLFWGALLQTNPDRSLLMSLQTADGGFQWLSRSVRTPWVGGLTLLDGETLYCYGSENTGAYVGLTSTPRLTLANIQISPRPLRGPANGFGTGSITIDLPLTSRVSLALFRERSGMATPIATDLNWAAGRHELAWTPGGTNGFTDSPQLGFLLAEISENGGASYTLTLLIPINVFPDIFGHWAFAEIVTMLYNKLVSGYPDQTFRPDNLLTRAESCSIVATSLGLSGPSPSFRTKFTDLEGHWARSAILALEERSIVGGFAEPDGTYIFRPNLSMTRAQEARILSVAYHIPPAPADFKSKFTDINGHWAKNEIMALEYAGYVNGFAEPNGTFTFRPEQNLTRAELCAVVVRIRNLTR